MKSGRLYLLITAIIYGIIPVFAKQVALSGGDGATLVFLRSALCLPFLFLYILWSGRDLRLNKKQLTDTATLTFLGNAPAMVLLYAAYERGSVGAASMLHFIYPFLIVLAGVVLFKNRLSAKKWLGVALAAIGVILSLDMKTDTVGAVLAILSGVFYAFFVIYLDRSGADKMDYWILTFYLSLGMAAASFLMCFFGKGLKFPQTQSGFFCALLVSALTTLVAIPLFQRGVEKEGAQEAGILSMAEPVTSIILGALLLGESVTLPSILGVILMALGLILS